MDCDFITLLNSVEESEVDILTNKEKLIYWYIKLQHLVNTNQNYDELFDVMVNNIEFIDEDIEHIVYFMLELKQNNKLLIKTAIFNLHQYQDLECCYTIFDKVLEIDNCKQHRYLYAVSLIDGLKYVQNMTEEEIQESKINIYSDDRITSEDLYYKSEKLLESIMKEEVIGSELWLDCVSKILYISEKRDSYINAKNHALELSKLYENVHELKVYYAEYLSEFKDIGNQLTLQKILNKIIDITTDKPLRKKEFNLLMNLVLISKENLNQIISNKNQHI